MRRLSSVLVLAAAVAATVFVSAQAPPPAQRRRASDAAGSPASRADPVDARRRPRRRPGDDADHHRVARRRHDSRAVHAGRRPGLAAVCLEQRAGRRRELRADRPRSRRRHRQRHRRHPALDALEHSGGRAQSARSDSASLQLARRHAADQRRAVRTIAGRARRRPARRITTCSSCIALDTMLDVPAVGQSPPLTRAAVIAAMAGHVRGKARLHGTLQAAVTGRVRPALR